MDRAIWSKLPTELVRKIIEESEPSIDVQLCFKIKPKKIPEAKAWRLWYLLTSHDGLIYDLESLTLHNFRIPGIYTVRRPVSLVSDGDLWIFNQEEAPYNIEICMSNGDCLVMSRNDTWITELRVLLRGSGLARALNVSGSTF